MKEDTLSKEKGLAEISLKRVLEAVFHKLWFIVFAAILGAVLAFAGTWFLITPQYEASSVFYVNNTDLSIGAASLSIESGDISASKSLVNTYIVILKDRVTLSQIIESAGVDMHYTELEDSLVAEALDETEVFKVVVTNSDPIVAEKLANAVTEVLPNRLTGIIEGSSAKVVSEAITPVSPSSPNNTINTILGFLLGLVISIGIVMIRVMFDTTIRSREHIEQITDVPILAEVPNMGSKNGLGGHYRSTSHKASRTKNKKQSNEIIGPGIGFASTEAYKLLRTKLQYSFADEEAGRIIAMSSAFSGEGKSTTAINLAYSLAQLNKKVILIDCDMRRPKIAEKLKLKKKPGLSGVLTRQCKITEAIQIFKKEKVYFHMISADQCPPNPAELLSSRRMSSILNLLKDTYDYIILDFPPVCEVSDAMAVAKDIDGMLMVVRQNYSNQNLLKDAIAQLKYVGINILGITFNDVEENLGSYGNKYYKKYYGRYYTSQGE